MCHCKNIEMGSFDNQIRLINNDGKNVGIDRCIAEEIKELWFQGTNTIASCCGHNKIVRSKELPGTVLVEDKDIERMKDKGYKQWHNPSRPKDKDGFLTKTIYKE